MSLSLKYCMPRLAARLALRSLLALALLGLPLATARAADPGEAPAAKEPPPTFAPGAEVKLLITLQAPEQWVLNYLVPIRLQFDEKALKEAPFKVSQSVWDFKIEHYVPRHTFELPVVLKTGLPDGEVKIPVQVMCSICAAGGEECTFAMETIVAKVKVQAKAAEGAKNQALAKGSLPLAYRLSLP